MLRGENYTVQVRLGRFHISQKAWLLFLLCNSKRVVRKSKNLSGCSFRSIALLVNQIFKFTIKALSKFCSMLRI
jgi:hypothetical protein